MSPNTDFFKYLLQKKFLPLRQTFSREIFHVLFCWFLVLFRRIIWHCVNLNAIEQGLFFSLVHVDFPSRILSTYYRRCRKIDSFLTERRIKQFIACVCVRRVWHLYEKCCCLRVSTLVSDEKFSFLKSLQILVEGWKKEKKYWKNFVLKSDIRITSNTFT